MNKPTYTIHYRFEGERKFRTEVVKYKDLYATIIDLEDERGEVVVIGPNGKRYAGMDYVQFMERLSKVMLKQVV